MVLVKPKMRWFAKNIVFFFGQLQYITRLLAIKITIISLIFLDKLIITIIEKKIVHVRVHWSAMINL